MGEIEREVESPEFHVGPTTLLLSGKSKEMAAGLVPPEDCAPSAQPVFDNAGAVSEKLVSS